MANDELGKFAAGASVEEIEESSVTETVITQPEQEAETLLDNEIVEKCPMKVYNKREGVAYGSFIHDTYYSTTCEMERGVSILLPADYAEDKQYPVLYLMHGIFGNEYSFSGDAGNKIAEIITNMAADGLIEDTILVCPNIYATKDTNLQPGFSTEQVEPYDHFADDLAKDLMPFMESHYRIKTGRENTYLAGFSMGGRQTLYTSLKYPELFGYVCAISPCPGLVPGVDGYMEHVGTLAEEEVKYPEGAVVPEVLIICCGTKDSVVGQFPASYHALYEKNGIDHIWYEIQGADHDNNAIRSGVYNLLRQIAYDKQ